MGFVKTEIQLKIKQDVFTKCFFFVIIIKSWYKKILPSTKMKIWRFLFRPILIIESQNNKKNTHTQ